ncbi:MAG TPA: hypothetical protein VLX29_10680 [Nitrospirota bacterium]|nr:hypothetical protein [Nitrospirota bacterium]
MALIIVLLVTTLLIALVFEFAYATRVSLRAAVNFRDSQRAYFLARAGITAFVKYNALRDQIPPGEWAIVPMISTGDTEVKVKWEDEKGKLSINSIDRTPVSDWIDKLFIEQGIATDVYDRMIARKKEGLFNLITELHTLMKDEDYKKVAQFLTPYYSNQNVNLNTASLEVLMSLGCSEGPAKTIIELRTQERFSDIEKIKPYLPATFSLNNYNIEKTTLYRVYSYATVGGYTKQIEAVIDLSTSGTSTIITSTPTPLYWRAL